MTQGGYQVIIILPIRSKMVAAKNNYTEIVKKHHYCAFLRFLYLTESSPPSFKVRGLQMTINFIH